MATTASTSSLPPKPSAEVSQDFSPSSPSSSDTLNPSTTSSPLCAICASNPSRYTCPRCSLRTCSLPCSTAHKTLGEGCSGIRNKAAYVPMNQYGYMALMNDYAFLEEIERKVTEAGREIVQGGYQNPAPNGTAAFAMNSERGRGRGRGRGGRGMGGRHQQRTGNTSKRDMLRSELDFRDIEMDMLPVGMEKRTLNQSTWDSTCVILHVYSPRTCCTYLCFPPRKHILQNEHSTAHSRVRLPPTPKSLCTFFTGTRSARHTPHTPQ